MCWVVLPEEHCSSGNGLRNRDMSGAQVEFHRYLLALRLARCPKGKSWLGRKLWKAKTVLSFCMGNKC